jgi:hypothetical protein
MPNLETGFMYAKSIMGTPYATDGDPWQEWELLYKTSLYTDLCDLKQITWVFQ